MRRTVEAPAWAIAVVVTTLMVGCASTRAQRVETAAPPTSEEEASAQDVRELLKLTGAGALGVQAFAQMLPSLKQLAPGAPESFWQGVNARLKPDELAEMMIPIYRKHLTAHDVRALTAFYRTPEGQKLIRVQPMLMRDSMAAGQEWGRRIARDVVEEARARGFQVKT